LRVRNCVDWFNPANAQSHCACAAVWIGLIQQMRNNAAKQNE
jgi:hypothetical protein